MSTDAILIAIASGQLVILAAAWWLFKAQQVRFVQSLADIQRAEGDRTRADLLNAQGAFLGAIQNAVRDASAQQVEQLGRLAVTLDQKLGELRHANDQKLSEMRQVVEEKLQSTLERRLGESSKQVSERLEAVFKGLGEMQTLARGVDGLTRLMTNVKARGTWGEVQLGNLLEQILAPEQFGRNVAMLPGSRSTVEFAIKLPGQGGAGPVWLPIDAKFPTEDYARLVDAAEKADSVGVEQAGKALERRVLEQAWTISEKYICPPHSTDFGIMFLPSEGLYAEVLRRPGLAERLQAEFRVIAAGPTTIAALLNSLQVGFKTLAIQERASEVWGVLASVKLEFARFGAIVASVKKKLDSASQELEEDMSVRARAIERKLREVELPPGGETAPGGGN